MSDSSVDDDRVIDFVDFTNDDISESDLFTSVPPSGDPFDLANNAPLSNDSVTEPDESIENEPLFESTTANDLVNEITLLENMAIDSSFQDLGSSGALVYDSTDDDSIYDGSVDGAELDDAIKNHQTTDAVVNDAATKHQAIDTALLNGDLKDNALNGSRCYARNPLGSIELNSDIAKYNRFSITSNCYKLDEFINKQKEVACKTIGLSLWPKSLRLCHDDLGIQYVVENDPVNPCLGKQEYDFLVHILRAPRAHYIWAEAANNMENVHSANKSPLVREVLGALTTCLEIVLQELEKVQSLRHTSTWARSHCLLSKWLPQTVCRLFGYKIEDGEDSYLGILEIIGGNVFKMTNFMIGTECMVLAGKQDISEIQQDVESFIQMVSLSSRQHLPIQNEIEYFREKAAAIHEMP
ncbi:hypothetical protein ACHAQJ_006325 [Trichoderma viride]